MRAFGLNKSALAAMVMALIAGQFMAGIAVADELCGSCDKEIVTNGELADCFLDQYDQFAAAGDGAILVDLSACAQDRGVVEALAGPTVKTGLPVAEPSLKFMVTPTQLACLRKKLQTPGLKLDPTAKIDLESCG